MKKLIGIVISILLLLPIFAPLTFATTLNYERVNKMVNDTNNRIQSCINDANKKANEEIDDYILKIRLIQNGKKIVKLEDELIKIENEAKFLDENSKKYIDLKEKKSDIESKIKKEKDEQDSKIQQIQNELRDLTIELNAQELQNPENTKLIDKISKITEKLLDNDIAVTELNRGLEKKLDRIIAELVSKTDEMAAKLVQDTAKEGVEVQCEYVQVKIGGRDVLVDPINIHN